jgi:hypothetical protein
MTSTAYWRGGRGPSVVPGKPDESWIIKAVHHTDPKLKMPPDEKISDEEIEILTQWIVEGAYWLSIAVKN